jgi:beta-phosphoglucomutase-like phosphatase (HAD superfamily)
MAPGGEFHAVIWDIDGTLVDSEPLHKEAMIRVSADHGRVLPREPLDALLGKTTLDSYALVQQLAPVPLSHDEWILAAEVHFLSMNDRLRPRAQVVEHLALFARLGLKQGAASNATRGAVETNLRCLAPHFTLEAVVARDDVVRPKPHPEPYLLAAERLGVDPARCIAIEDSPVGARAAYEAGMHVVAWPQSPGLHFSHATRIVSWLSEIDWHALVAPRAEP